MFVKRHVIQLRQTKTLTSTQTHVLTAYLNLSFNIFTSKIYLDILSEHELF